jgi:D-3-phosphoglycerate dehydrogenase
MTIKVFQADPFAPLMPYAYERDAIARVGGELIIGDCNTEADVIAQAADAEVILVTWKSVVTPAVMDALPKLRLVIRWGVGYDQIDAVAAQARGIAVGNAPAYASEDVAEQAIALMLACSRRVSWFHERMRKGEWPAARANPIFRLKGRTLGLIGIGRIAAAVAWRARGLGMNVIACDPALDDTAIRARQAEPRSYDQVLAESDFISVHVPLAPATRGLINADAFAKMKKGAVVINTSRGPVIDERALIAALESGHLGGAGLDVFEVEPLAADSPLRTMEHVVVTPHMAAYSEESWQGLRDEMCETVTDWISTGWSKAVVNPGVRATLRPRG